MKRKQVANQGSTLHRRHDEKESWREERSRPLARQSSLLEGSTDTLCPVSGSSSSIMVDTSPDNWCESSRSTCS